MRYSCLYVLLIVRTIYRKEPPVLDYTTQQMKLFPQLATSHAFHFIGKYMMDTYNKVNAAMSNSRLDSLSEVLNHRIMLTNALDLLKFASYCKHLV